MLENIVVFQYLSCKTTRRDSRGSGGITDYLNGFQYKDGELQFFPHAEGYVNNTVVGGNNNYNYVFNYTDHLGNVRLSYTNSVNGLEILEENNYYPFGLKHANYNMGKKNYETMMSGEIKPVPVVSIPYNYKYNGKELQDELGLNMYDYGARNYDPAIGRWMNIDMKAEKYLNLSPYVYVADNPITNIDPDGKDIIFIVGEGKETRNFIYRKGNFYDMQGNKAPVNSPTMFRVLATYRKIENSNNKRLKGVLHHLETSKLHHYVKDGKTNEVVHYGIPSGPDKGSPVGSLTTYNFSKENDDDFEKTEGVPNDIDATVAHEMRHQYDNDIGNRKDEVDGANEKDPVEIRAVFFENLMRQTLKQLERKEYGELIDPAKLKNPPNNIFPTDN